MGNQGRVKKPKVLKRVEPEYVTVADAEVMTGVSAWTWRKRAYSGQIASVKDTRRLLIPVLEVRRWMSERERPALETR